MLVIDEMMIELVCYWCVYGLFVLLVDGELMLFVLLVG